MVMKAERDAEHAARKAAHGDTHVKANEMRAFLKNAGIAIRQNWFLLIYMIVLMSGFNSVSHGSQDLCTYCFILLIPSKFLEEDLLTFHQIQPSSRINSARMPQTRL